MPVNEGACTAETDSHANRPPDEPPKASMLAPDLATYCLNLPPSLILYAQDHVAANGHATGHQSHLICPFGAGEPRNPTESGALWDSNMQCTAFNDDEMQVDTGNEGTSNEQCSVRLAPEFPQRPGTITSLELTEKSSLNSTHHLNEHDSPGENANDSSHDPKIPPTTLAEETCLCDPNNTASLQLHVDRETEDSAPIIAEGLSGSN